MSDHIIEINKKYYANYGYGVEILVDCDPSDATIGGSEMVWFDTEEEQERAYQEALAAYKDELRIETTKDGFVVLSEGADLGFYQTIEDAYRAIRRGEF